jgi:hypothetical protein
MIFPILEPPIQFRHLVRGNLKGVFVVENRLPNLLDHGETFFDANSAKLP